MHATVLPDPASIGCPAPDGSLLFERGIVENIIMRVVTNETVGLRFDRESDGDSRSLDGNREDLIALLSDTPDGQVVAVCVASAVAGAPFEACTLVTLHNRGHR